VAAAVAGPPNTFTFVQAPLNRRAHRRDRRLVEPVPK
jgi:hypothetical protein